MCESNIKLITTFKSANNSEGILNDFRKMLLEELNVLQSFNSKFFSLLQWDMKMSNEDDLEISVMYTTLTFLCPSQNGHLKIVDLTIEQIACICHQVRIR